MATGWPKTCRRARNMPGGFVAMWAFVLVLAGCGPAASRPSVPAPVEPASSAPPAVKTITLGVPEPVKGFGLWNFNTAGGAASVWDIHSSPLVTNDAQGFQVGRLAGRLPSLADGTIVILSDGRMQTTWALRPNVKWHDGSPFTADDLTMSWEEIGRASCRERV